MSRLKVTMIVLCLIMSMLVSSVTARPQDVQILKNESDVRPDGFDFSYETSDGTKHDEMGYPNEDGSLSVQGSFSFVGDDGVTYTVNFVADENGFRPEGDHLPKEEGSSGLQIPPQEIGFAPLPPSAVLSLIG